MIYLDEIGVEYKDFGVYIKEAADYPEIAKAVSKEVAAHKFDKGILVCGTGIGMSIVANKIKGIRASLCHDTYSARVSRAHNNANVIVFGAKYMDSKNIKPKTLFLLLVNL